MVLRALQGLFECTISPSYLLIIGTWYKTSEHARCVHCIDHAPLSRNPNFPFFFDVLPVVRSSGERPMLDLESLSLCVCMGSEIVPQSTNLASLPGKGEIITVYHLLNYRLTRCLFRLRLRFRSQNFLFLGWDYNLTVNLLLVPPWNTT